MMTSQLISLRLACGAAVAAAGLLSASGASAQTAPASYFFQVENDTLSGGDPVFSVTDNLTFSNLRINEVFTGGFSQTISLGSLDTNTLDAFSNTFSTSSPLVSAVLTGSIGSGPAQTVLTQTSLGGPVTPQYVSSTFSASLFGPAQTGTALGTFSLVDGNNNVVSTVNILAPAAVPEASTTVSLGLLLALGLGALAVSRRRAASVNSIIRQR